MNPNDPGNCTKQKRGKFVVVKDRSHNDKVLVCVARHGKYQWDVINGINNVLINVSNVLFTHTLT